MKKIFSIVLLVVLMLTLSSCTKIAKQGDVVLVHYIWTYEDGTQFDNSYERESPIEFTVLAWEMISGFDSAVVGMKVWEKKSITLAPKDAYGERDENNIVTLPKEQFKEFEDAWIVLETGAILPTPMWNLPVLGADETTITIDWNNPMAGKTLNFDLELVEIKASK